MHVAVRRLCNPDCYIYVDTLAPENGVHPYTFDKLMGSFKTGKDAQSMEIYGEPGRSCSLAGHRFPWNFMTGGNERFRYVFHCHILEHEDNDIMRPYNVVGAWSGSGLSTCADLDQPQNSPLKTVRAQGGVERVARTVLVRRHELLQEADHRRGGSAAIS